jgi:hypothetical protein
VASTRGSKLLAHQPDRERVPGRLWNTALRKAWRLEQFEARKAEMTTRRAGACSPVEARHRWLEALGALGERSLGVAGHGDRADAPAPPHGHLFGC